MNCIVLRGGKAECTILDMHGGAFAFPAAPHMVKIASMYALSGFRVIIPDYPLLPEHRHPEALEKLRLLAASISDLALIAGDSAGGFLALMTAAEMKVKPPLMLIYPAVQPDTATLSMKMFSNTPMWNSTLSRWMWENYLGHEKFSQPEIAGIPKAFIETAEYDPLRDEGKDLAAALAAAGTETELSETEGTVHGYDILWKKPYTRALISRRLTWLGNL